MLYSLIGLGYGFYGIDKLIKSKNKYKKVY